MKKFLLIIIIFVLTLPSGLLAIEESGVNNNLLATISPSNPGPGEAVTISLTSYGFDINTSIISWYVNNELKAKDWGRKTFTFNLGSVGQQTKIIIYVQAKGGQKASKTFVFDPSEIDFLWETKTSGPIFYKGKLLPSSGSSVKVLALPYIINRAGQKIDSADLIFNWEKNGISMENFSGLGKNSVIFNTDQKSGQLKVGLKLINPTTKTVITKDLIINLVTPEILFYEKKPLEGINYGQVLPAEYSLFNDEVTVRAEPYFLPLNNNLLFKYFWTLDRSSADNRPGDPLSITLRQNRNISGSNRVSFSAQNKDSTFSNSLIIKYGNSLLKPQF